MAEVDEGEKVALFFEAHLPGSAGFAVGAHKFLVEKLVTVRTACPPVGWQTPECPLVR